MSSAEFAEWMAYYSTEPFGDLRADYRSGILASLVANLMIGKNQKPAEPLDFVIHDNAKPGETVLDPKRPELHDQAEADAELRRRSQQEQINAIKRFTAAKKRKG